jgi:hypothetical protein
MSLEEGIETRKSVPVVRRRDEVGSTGCDFVCLHDCETDQVGYETPRLV